MNVSTVSLLVGPTDIGEDLVQQSTGRIVVGGWYRSSSGGNGFDWALAGLTSGGAPDSTFGLDARVRVAPGVGFANSRATALALDGSTDRIYMSGCGRRLSSDPSSATIMRFLSNGAVDSTYATDGRLIEQRMGTSWAHDIALQNDGRLVAAGWAFADHPMCSRYLMSGAPDGAFGNDTIAGVMTLPISGAFNGLAIDRADGSIVAVGRDGGEVLVARYTSAGVLDPAFANAGRGAYDVDSGAFASEALAVAIDDYGRAVLTGSCLNGDKLFVLRLLRNGAPDSTFHGTGAITLDIPFNNPVGYDLLLQPDCKVVVVGGDDSGQQSHILVRLMPDGSPDPSFGVDGLVADQLPTTLADGAWLGVIRSQAGSLLTCGWGNLTHISNTDMLVGEYMTSTAEGVDCEATGSTGLSRVRSQDAIGVALDQPGRRLHLVCPGGIGAIAQVYDSRGALIAGQRLFAESAELSLPGASGLYVVSIRFPSGATAFRRFVLE